MKRIRQAAIVLGIVTGIILGNGCEKKDAPAGEPPKPTEVSAEKNSFQRRHLEAGYGRESIFLSQHGGMAERAFAESGWLGAESRTPSRT